VLQTLDKFNLGGSRYRLLFILQAVAGTDLNQRNARRQHDVNLSNPGGLENQGMKRHEFARKGGC
jgi:hypothetical protein